MLKLKLWAASLTAMVLLCPAGASAATVVNLLFSLGNCSGSVVGNTLHLDQSGGGTCVVDVFMETLPDGLGVSSFNILLSETNLDMKLFTFTDGSLGGTTTNGLPDGSPVGINAFGAPTNGVKIGTLELQPSIVGGSITLGGVWVDDDIIVLGSHPFGNEGATLAVVVPEPSSLGLLLGGILGLSSWRLRGKR